MWKKILTFILGALFVLLFIVFVLGLVVNRDLLSPDLYTQALEENNAYERVYTEFLADPLVQQAFKGATGIQIDLLSEEIYAQIVSALYLIVPPQQMEAGMDAFFTNLTGYLKGDLPELQEDVNFGSAVTPEVLADHVVKAATAIAIELVDKSEPIVEKKTEQLIEEDLVAYLDNFNEGRLVPIPRRLLRASVSSFTTAANEQLVTVMLGPANETASPETRLQMEAALAEDDLPSAIALAITERLKLVVEAKIAFSEESLAESQALIGISGLAMALGETRDSVVGGLNTARGYIDILQMALLPLAIILVILLFIIVWLNSDDFGSALRAAGWTLTIASGLVLLLWLVAGFVLRAQVSSGLAAAALGPVSLDAIVDDVIGSLIRGVWESIWTTALVFFILGLVFLAFGYSRGLLGFLEGLLSGVWAYKWWVLGGFILVFVLLPLLIGLFRGDARAANEPCNGHPELCDRPINEVAYASSHNSMSIAEYGWVWPMHDGTLTEQLDAGVRALLIDTHYMDDPTVREEFLNAVSEESEDFETQDIYELTDREAFVMSLSDRSVDVVSKAFSTVAEPAQVDEFLCHQFCGLGWTPLADSLEEIRVWLEENPREVLFLIIQDEITPEDTDKDIIAAGLDEFIYTHPEGAPWPTLRQLIDSNERLLIMAENEGPPPAWYTNAWDVTEETPYTFIFPEQFSCEPNRGDTEKPFFLLNHWIQRGSPNRVDGALVNEYDFLLARAQQCAEERGKMPNFVAVNWYRQGDLFDVVDTLNGVYEAQE
jgi:hypothetical protein